MKIADLLDGGRTYSFEFAPPRTDEQERRLDKVLDELAVLEPSFVSVTYGAGGSTRDKTREIVEHLHHDTPLTVMPHLTCVAQSRAEVTEIVEGYAASGIENILALGGDPPADGTVQASDFTYATELIEVVRRTGDFSVGVAAFPEGHPRSPDLATDRRHLAAKLEMADFGITQFFFDADDYFRMVDDLAGLGCETPVLPGIMLFLNVDGLRRMAGMNAARIPPELSSRLDAVAGDASAVRAVAVETAIDLCQRLLAGGAPGLHLYTMNFSSATKELYVRLGLPSGSAP